MRLQLRKQPPTTIYIVYRLHAYIMYISVRGPQYIELLEKEEDSRLFFVVDLLLPVIWRGQMLLYVFLSFFRNHLN